jgi:ABC-type sugar transport system ATPase subunit
VRDDGVSVVFVEHVVRAVFAVSHTVVVLDRGQILAQGSRDKDELIVHDMNFDMIREVRNTWQFFRDRRPDTYGSLVAD